MRVFVTGASGFVGSAIVRELLQAGHSVLGLVRSDAGAESVANAGAEVYRGDINDQEAIQKATEGCDAVIHTAFNHDFSRFKQNCEDDRKVIEALGDALAGSYRPLVVTSGVGILNLGNRQITENDNPASSDITPRAASEEAAHAVAAKGVKPYIVRLPPTTHGQGDHGFVPMIIDIAKQKGESAYVGDGKNRWAAVHRLDAAVMYRLIIEQQPEQVVFHPVAEEGILFRDIATAIGNGLGMPTVSKVGEDVKTHFGWFQHFASIDCLASSEKSRTTLGWAPVQPSLMDDLVPGIYF